MIFAIVPALAGATGLFVTNSGSNTVSPFSLNGDGSLSPVLCSPMVLCQTGSGPAGAAINPSGTFLYAANFSSNTVSVFAIRPDGSLLPVDCHPSTNCNAGLAPAGPDGVAVSPSGRFLYVTNYGGNIAPSTVSAFAVNADGSLSPIACNSAPSCTTEPGAEGVAVSPSGRFLYVTSFFAPGPIDVFAINADGSLSPVACNPTANCNAGGGPQGVAITPSGQFLYTADTASRTVSAFAINADGSLTPIACSPASNCATGINPSGLAISPSGRFLYTSNYGDDSISAFAINADGSLSPIACNPTSSCNTGEGSYALAISPSGRFLYAPTYSSTGVVSVFAIGADGSLSPVTCTPASNCNVGVNAGPLSITAQPDQAPAAAFRATVGQAASASSFDASASSDVDGQVVRFDWSFGDGTTLQNGGVSPQHVYANPGSYVVSLTVSDDAGCSTTQVFTGQTVSCNGGPVATASATITVLAHGTTTATASAPGSALPIFSRVFETASTWRLGNARVGFARRRPPVGTTFGFTLNEAARVRFAFTQTTAGHLVGHKCVARPPGHARKPCRRTATAGTLTFAAHSGTNKIRFQGRLSPTRKLKPGRYKLIMSATSAAGKRSVPRSLTFTIVKH